MKKPQKYKVESTLSIYERRILVLAFLASALFVVPFAKAATQTWDGGGDTTTWTDAVNWDVLPSAGDDILIGAAAMSLDATGIELNGDQTVGLITLNGNLNKKLIFKSGDTLSFNAGGGLLYNDAANVAQNVDFDANISINGAGAGFTFDATNDVNQTITINGNLNDNGHGFSTSGRWRGNLYLAGTNTLSGTITATGNHTIQFSDINQLSSATVDLNDGAVLKYNGAGNATMSTADINMANAFGELVIQNGIEYRFNNTITVDNNTTLILKTNASSGSKFVFDGSTTISGTGGTIDLRAGRIEIEDASVMNGIKYKLRTNLYGGDHDVGRATFVLKDTANALTGNITIDTQAFGGSSNGYTHRIIGGHATGTATFSGNVIYNDTTTGSPSQKLILQTTTAGATTVFSGSIQNGTNSLGLDIEGPGTVKFSGSTANTYSLVTHVKSGTLILGKDENVNAIAGYSVEIDSGATLQLNASHQISNTTNIVLNGGTLMMNGFNEHVNNLTLSADSVIDFAGGNSELKFLGATIDFQGTSKLSIWNWDGQLHVPGGNTQLIFSGATLTDEQLERVFFYTDDGINLWSPFPAIQVTGGEVIPVPEASTWFFGLSLLGVVAVHRYLRNK